MAGQALMHYRAGLAHTVGEAGLEEIKAKYEDRKGRAEKEMAEAKKSLEMAIQEVRRGGSHTHTHTHTHKRARARERESE